MANYVQTSRSNYFRIHADRFDDLQLLAQQMEAELRRGEEPNTYALLGQGECSIFSYRDPATDEYEDTIEKLIPLLDNSIAVLVEVGAEKLRYLEGIATAIHPDGRIVSLSLVDIYELAAKAFVDPVEDTPETPAPLLTPAEY